MTTTAPETQTKHRRTHDEYEVLSARLMLHLLKELGMDTNMGGKDEIGDVLIVLGLCVQKMAISMRFQITPELTAVALTKWFNDVVMEPAMTIPPEFFEQLKNGHGERPLSDWSNIITEESRKAKAKQN